MYHIFNKFYLDLQFNVGSENICAIITDNDHAFVVNGTTVQVDKHIDQVFDRYGGTKGFFDAMLSSSTKSVIYCDVSNFVKLMIRFNKTFLPNLTPESGYLLCKLTFSFYKYVYGLTELRFKNLARNFINLEPPTFDEYKAVWDISKPFDYPVARNIRKFDFSFEHLLATYLYDSTHWTSAELKSKIEYFYARSVVDWLRAQLVGFSFDMYFIKRAHPDLFSGLDWKEPTMENMVECVPELGYLFELVNQGQLSDETKWVPDIRGNELLYNLYEKLRVSKAEPMDLVEQPDIFLAMKDGNLDPKQIIDFSLQHPTASTFGNGGFLARQFNTHLYQYLLNVYDEKDLETLKQWSLIGL